MSDPLLMQLSFLPGSLEWIILFILMAAGGLFLLLLLTGKKVKRTNRGKHDTHAWDEGVADRASGEGDAAGDVDD